MFWQNFTRLCANAGKFPSRVATDLGLSNSAAASWKKGAVPRERVLLQIADYFGVTVEDLLKDSDSEKLSADEQSLVTLYRGFNREGRGRVLDFVGSMKRSGMYEEGVDYFMKGCDADSL